MTNPHHENFAWALDPECAWGLHEQFRAAGAIFEAQGWRLRSLEISEPRQEPDGRYRRVSAVLEAADGSDLHDDEGDTIGRIELGRLPDVAPDGSVFWERRDYAPAAFVRLRPGLYEFGSSVPDPETGEDAEEDDPADEHDGTGQSDDDGAAGPDEPIPARLLVPPIGMPIRMAEHQVDRTDERGGAGTDPFVFVPNIGRRRRSAVVQALGALGERAEEEPYPAGTEETALVRADGVGPGRSSDRRPAALARYLLRACDGDRRAAERFLSDAFVPSVAALELDDGAEPAETGIELAGDPVDEATFVADLDNCRLMLAGHHLAAAFGSGLRSGMARSLQLSDPDPAIAATTLKNCVEEALDQSVRSPRRDPDGGLAPFDPVDDTNPLARFEQCRKVSRLGPGGFHPKHAPPLLRQFHPSHAGRLCPFLTPESDRVGLVRFLTFDAEVDREGTFGAAADIDGAPASRLLSASALLLPLLNHDDAVRGILGAKTIRQFVPIRAPEPPLIRTGFEEAVAARVAPAVMSTSGGTVVTSDDEIAIVDDTGTRREPLRRRRLLRPTSFGTDDSWQPADPTWVLDAAGARQIVRGEPLALQPGTALDAERGERSVVMAPGANAVCAFMPFRGLTIEDAVVVSSSLADRMTSRHLEEVTERLAPGEYCTSLPSDAIGPVAKDQELFTVHRMINGELAPVRTVRSPRGGRIVAADIENHESGVREFVLVLAVDRPLSPGDKVIARHGNKGVVSAVLPDEDMPLIHDYLGDGCDVRADIVISPFGPLRRQVIGLLHELHWGRLAHRGEAIPALGPLCDPEGPGQSQLAAALEAAACPWKARVEVDGVDLEDEVVVGTLHYLKLNHLAERKVQYQRSVQPSSTTGQPALVRLDELGQHLGRAQRLGEMEFWALQAYGADEVMADLLHQQRGHDSGVSPTLWKLMDHLAAAGIGTDLRFTDGSELAFDDLDALARTADRVVAVRFRLLEADADAPRSWIEPAALRVDLDARQKEAQTLGGRGYGDERTTHEPESDEVGDSRGRTLLFCDCGAVPVTPKVRARAGHTCPTCSRVRRWLSDRDFEHQIAYLRLPARVPHPWLTATLARMIDDIDRQARELGADEVVRGIDAARPDPGTSARLDWRRALHLLEELASDATSPFAPVAERALSLTLTRLPVAPAALRQEILGDERVIRSNLARAYADVAKRVEVIQRVELDDDQYEQLRAAVRGVLGDAEGRFAGEGTIADLLRFKEGLLRRYLLGTSAWDTARAVITPDPLLLIDEVGVPARVFEWLRLESGQPVLLNRTPTLLRSTMLALKAQKVDDSALHISPAIVPMIAGDFDGDDMMLLAPASGAARTGADPGVVERVRHRLAADLSPLRNLRSPQNGDLMIYRGEELKAGDDARAAVERAGAELASAPDAESDAAAARLRDTYVDAFDEQTGCGSVSVDDLVQWREGTPVPALEVIVAGAFGGRRGAVDGLVGAADDAAGSSLLDGLGRRPMFDSTARAIDGLTAKKLATPVAGDVTKQLVEALYDVSVGAEDCGSTDTLPLGRLSPRASRRQQQPEGRVRSPITCLLMASTGGRRVCAACYGDDLSTGAAVEPSTRVGILAAQAIGEQGTQLALKSIHRDSGKADIGYVSALFAGRKRHLPTLREDGGFDDPPEKGGPPSCRQVFLEDPIRFLAALRWAYTDEGVVKEPGAQPTVDDVHLELVVAFLRVVAEERPGRAPLTQAVARRGPLARASMRGDVRPLCDAAIQADWHAVDSARERLAVGDVPIEGHA